MQDLAPGLYVVATPLGNARDITLRALDVLRACRRIYCEDTRITARLCARHGITTKRAAYHEHNAARKRPQILRELADGASLALVSDAGTPLISDPGLPLIRAVRAAGHAIFSVPGPSAPIAALSIAGLPTSHFHFAGFLPPKSAARRAAIAALPRNAGTLVLFEAPHRLAALLGDINDLWGDAPTAVGRELTKRFEELRDGTAAELAAHFTATPPRGECVVLVSPPPEKTEAPDIDEQLAAALKTQSLRDAVAQVKAATGAPHRQVYARALALRAQSDA